MKKSLDEIKDKRHGTRETQRVSFMAKGKKWMREEKGKRRKISISVIGVVSNVLSYDGLMSLNGHYVGGKGGGKGGKEEEGR